MTDVRVLFVTTPNEEDSLRIAGTLVEERLIACVNILPVLRSIYRWEGKICDDAEQLLILKTVEGKVEAVTKRVVELHPYDAPEVIALPIVAGHGAYLDWIVKECGI